jgi:circadian clock protein KaiC
MQFLLEGAARGERCLYVTLSETRQEIEKVARSHGWNLAGVDSVELIPSENNLSSDAQPDLCSIPPNSNSAKPQRL